jgi:hypothetical protein
MKKMICMAMTAAGMILLTGCGKDVSDTREDVLVTETAAAEQEEDTAGLSDGPVSFSSVKFVDVSKIPGFERDFSVVKLSAETSEKKDPVTGDKYTATDFYWQVKNISETDYRCEFATVSEDGTVRSEEFVSYIPSGNIVTLHQEVLVDSADGFTLSADDISVTDDIVEDEDYTISAYTDMILVTDNSDTCIDVGWIIAYYDVNGDIYCYQDMKDAQGVKVLHVDKKNTRTAVTMESTEITGYSLLPQTFPAYNRSY